MTNFQPTATDLRPWYRQFWPWFLMGLPASVVVAGLTTFYIANEHADDLVVDEYYKNGLAINRQLEKKQLAESLNLSARLELSGNTVTVLVEGPEFGEQLHLQLSHPLEADRDFELTLKKIRPGVYTAAYEGTVAPRWHWVLQSQQGPRWRLDGRVSAEDIAHAHSG